MLVAVACGAPGGSPRGFGSRQILAVRDNALSLGGFTQDGARVYLSRTRSVTLPGGDTEQRVDLQLLDVATGALRPLVEGAMWGVVLPNGSRPGHSLVVQHYGAGAGLPTLSFIDEAIDERDDPSARLDIANTVPLTIRVGVTRADPMVVYRITNVVQRAWVGPPDALVPAPAGVRALDVAGVDATGAFLRVATEAQGTGAAHVLSHVPFDGSAPTEIVSSSLGETVVPAGGEEPNRPEPGPAPFDLLSSPLYACTPSPASPTDAPERCYLVYERVLSDGKPYLFLRHVGGGDAREVALPGALDEKATIRAASTLTLEIAPEARAVAWLSPGDSTRPDTLFTWDLATDRVGACPVAGDRIFYLGWFGGTDDTARFTAVVFRSGVGTVDSPLTLVFGATGGGCQTHRPGTDVVYVMSPSPDRTQVTWIQQGRDESSIHVAAADGSDDRSLARGPGIAASRFIDDRRLLFFRDGGDGIGVSWLDLTVEPIVEHPIAERISGRELWLGPRWALLVNRYSQQDDNGTLVAIDIETRAERAVSKLVTSVAPRWPEVPPGAVELPVAYLVRGRVASDQDGVWLAHLPLAEFATPP
jgi:hypothetical protein